MTEPKDLGFAAHKKRLRSLGLWRLQPFSGFT